MFTITLIENSLPYCLQPEDLEFHQPESLFVHSLLQGTIPISELKRNDQMHHPAQQLILHIYFEVESRSQHFPVPLPTCGGSRQQKPITQPWM